MEMHAHEGRGQAQGDLGQRTATVAVDSLRIPSKTQAQIELSFLRFDGTEGQPLQLTAEVIQHTRNRMALMVHMPTQASGDRLGSHPVCVTVPDPQVGLVTLRAVSASFCHPMLWIDAGQEAIVDRAPRVAYGETVLVGFGGGSMPCSARNISASGVSLRLPRDSRRRILLDPGMRCQVRFGGTAPVNRWIDADVIWCEDERAGLGFIDLTSYERSVISTYVTQVGRWQERLRDRLGMPDDARD